MQPTPLTGIVQSKKAWMFENIHAFSSQDKGLPVPPHSVYAQGLDPVLIAIPQQIKADAVLLRVDELLQPGPKLPVFLRIDLTLIDRVLHRYAPVGTCLCHLPQTLGPSRLRRGDIIPASPAGSIKTTEKNDAPPTPSAGKL